MPASTPLLTTRHFVFTMAAAGLTALTSCAEPPEEAEAKIVEVGAGSYSLTRPEPCEPLPETIYRTDDLKGATPTNQWWSSLVWQPFSQSLFAHPLAMLCHEEGLAVTYPGDVIDGSSGNIMGGGIAKEGDFFIGHSEVSDFPSARCAAFSDWFITAEFAKDSAALRTSIGHGSPFIYGRVKGGKARIVFAEKPQIWSGDENSSTLGISVRGRHYGIFGATGSTWEGMDGSIFTNQSEKDYFSIALLPDNQPDNLKLFSRYAHNHVVDTRTTPKVDGGFLKTNYSFTTEAMEGSEDGTVFSLYPHQWKYTSSPLTEQSYQSVRGEMKIGTGTEFTTSVPIQGLLPMLPLEGIPDRDRMVAYLKEQSAAANPEFKDTYWEGKHLGILTTLSGIAEVIGETKLQDEFNNEIKRRLENWFTASPGENSPLFYYNETWGALIGSVPSYGSDSQLNDHHFHYGYFIRAAATVARLDAEWAKKWGPMVEILIRDIASPALEDPLFPHMRCFDAYAGHSWASGHADFGDGNNQESSSESMNAWYGMMLWGEATNNELIRDTGIYLFNTERTAVEEYWFDVSGTNFPKDFPNVALGMIWGGKGAFATWFSGDIDCIHGINWLPFTPASIYMGRFPDYVKKNHDRIVEKREGGSDYNNGWGDLVVMFNALSDPKSAANYIDSNPDCSLEGGNTHAFMYHWIHTLERLGLNDASVTADHPFVNVYIKDGKRTYAAYNFGDTPLEVRFSDGTSMTAAPKSLTVKP
ncbi:glycosyl hydrolase [Haloferula sp.]|uniref:glycosyl hydrolase n=1 Tax=Haloferula sp. TaxID=2497595 RepID=UPI003C78590B